MNEKILEIVLASFVADAYSLGAHWVYSQDEIKESPLDWNNLNSPISPWHTSKQKGEFTHYGDQMSWLYEYILKENEFNQENYIKIWKEHMDFYKGYKDSSTKDTLNNLKNNQELPCGAKSHDLSIIGRIPPLLLVCSDEKTFLKNVKDFVGLTHNSEEVLESADFFAKILWLVHLGNPIIQSITEVKDEYSQTIKNYVNDGLNNPHDTLESIEEFGSACSVNGGFQGAIYILNKYDDDFKSAITMNAKAGGDSSSRGMIIAMLLVAAYGKKIIPNNWILQMAYKI